VRLAGAILSLQNLYISGVALQLIASFGREIQIAACEKKYFRQLYSL
jgi:hypothetical protein